MNVLSPSGRSRREAMLAELTDAMERIHHRRRRQRRAIAGMAGIALFVLAALLVQPLASSRSNPPGSLADGAGDRGGGQIVRHHEPEPQPTPSPACVITIVHTDPAVLDRMTRQPQSSAIILDDQALLAMLDAINRPTGLIHFAGEARLTAAVTDRDLKMRDAPGKPNPPL